MLLTCNPVGEKECKVLHLQSTLMIPKSNRLLDLAGSIPLIMFLVHLSDLLVIRDLNRVQLVILVRFIVIGRWSY